MTFGLDHAERAHDRAKKNHKREKVVGRKIGRRQKYRSGESDNIVCTLVFISRLSFRFRGECRSPFDKRTQFEA